MVKDIQLLQALNTKLFHDLSSSVGTIDNCLSLIDNDDKTISEKAKKLVFIESNMLVNKIKILKNIYGFSESENEISITFFTKLLSDFFDNNAIKLNIHFQKGLIYLEGFIAKAVMCLAVLISERIPVLKSININIFTKGGNNITIKLVAYGNNIKFKDEWLKILDPNSKSRINVYNCREHYINALCKNNGYFIQINQLSNAIEYNIGKIN